MRAGFHDPAFCRPRLWVDIYNTNADAGEGSLRAAIEQANQNCSPAPCKILFDMPVDALNTITPSTPLPAITADRVFIDGGSKITIDGTAAHYGLDLRARCESVVQGLELRNFGDQGLAVATGHCNDILDQRRVSGNVIAGNFAPKPERRDAVTLAKNSRLGRRVEAGPRRMSPKVA